MHQKFASHKITEKIFLELTLISEKCENCRKVLDKHVRRDLTQSIKCHLNSKCIIVNEDTIDFSKESLLGLLFKNE